MTGASGSSRFVVLRHTGLGEPHFDLMIERAPGSGQLLTWRAAAWPLRNGTALTRVGAHRRAYLEYEGPISGERGEVRRIAGGWCRVERLEGGAVGIRFEAAELGHWQLPARAELPEPVKAIIPGT